MTMTTLLVSNHHYQITLTRLKISFHPLIRSTVHNDAIAWKQYGLFSKGIHWSLENLPNTKSQRDSPHKGSVMWSFGVYLISCWWFETPSRSYGVTLLRFAIFNWVAMDLHNKRLFIPNLLPEYIALQQILKYIWTAITRALFQYPPQDVLSSDLIKYRSREILVVWFTTSLWNSTVLPSSAAEVLVKFQSNRTMLWAMQEIVKRFYYKAGIDTDITVKISICQWDHNGNTQDFIMYEKHLTQWSQTTQYASLDQIMFGLGKGLPPIQHRAMVWPYNLWSLDNQEQNSRKYIFKKKWVISIWKCRL